MNKLESQYKLLNKSKKNPTNNIINYIQAWIFSILFWSSISSNASVVNINSLNNNKLEDLTARLLQRNWITHDKYQIVSNYFGNNFYWDKNQFLQELLAEPMFKEIYGFLELNKWITIKVWKRKIKLYWRLNLYKALIDYRKHTKIDNLYVLINAYELKLNRKLQNNEEIDDVYLITYKQWITRKEVSVQSQSNNWTELENYDKNTAYIWLKSILVKQYSGVQNFEHILPTDSTKLLGKLPVLLWKNRTTLLFIGLHWDINWNSYPIQKTDYSYINNLAKKYSNLRVVVESCHSKDKFKDKFWRMRLARNITITSWSQIATNWYSRFIAEAYNRDENWVKKWDYNYDGSVDYQEASIYTYIKYNASFVTLGL